MLIFSTRVQNSNPFLFKTKHFKFFTTMKYQKRRCVVSFNSHSVRIFKLQAVQHYVFFCVQVIYFLLQAMNLFTQIFKFQNCAVYHSDMIRIMSEKESNNLIMCTSRIVLANFVYCINTWLSMYSSCAIRTGPPQHTQRQNMYAVCVSFNSHKKNLSEKSKIGVLTNYKRNLLIYSKCIIAVSKNTVHWLFLVMILIRL